MMSEIRTAAVIIRGRVQGVGYRMWTRSEAERLGLAGYVRNRPDGSVEAVFSGPAVAVTRMLDSCWQGPPGARVTEVVVSDHGAAPPQVGFVIR